MKYFISQPMSGFTVDKIKSDRNRAINYIKSVDKDAEILESYFEENVPGDSREAVYCLGKAISILSKSDIVYFVRGWNKSRGCKIEHLISKQYDIPVMEEDY